MRSRLAAIVAVLMLSLMLGRIVLAGPNDPVAEPTATSVDSTGGDTGAEPTPTENPFFPNPDSEVGSPTSEQPTATDATVAAPEPTVTEASLPGEQASPVGSPEASPIGSPVAAGDTGVACIRVRVRRRADALPARGFRCPLRSSAPDASGRTR